MLGTILLLAYMLTVVTAGFCIAAEVQAILIRSGDGRRASDSMMSFVALLWPITGLGLLFYYWISRRRRG